MKKLTLFLGALMITGASFAHDGKSCCKKDGGKSGKDCCKKEAPAKKKA
jgi:hypothetical protein